MLFERSKLVAAAAACAAWLAPSLALGQEDPVSATGKGITGGALLGGEVVMLTEAILDVKPAWAYVVGGLAGAGAGAFGGYYAEQMDDAKLSLYLLAGGMALAIPTTVAVLGATAYEPPVDYTEDQGPTDEPVAEPPQPEEGAGAQRGPAPPARQQRRAQRSAVASPRSLYLPQPAVLPALVGVGGGYLTLSVPAIEVRDVFTQRQLHEFAAKQQTEVRIPVFSAAF